MTSFRSRTALVLTLATVLFGCDVPPDEDAGQAASESQTSELSIINPLPDPGACTRKVTPVPGICTLEFNPVCGCDGQTYPNACAARVAGVAVLHAGKCKDTGPVPPPAGCQSSADCSERSYCRVPVGQCGSRGVCEARPAFCPLGPPPGPQHAPGLLLQVCGCDGVTYFSSCQAASRGVSVDHVGACRR